MTTHTITRWAIASSPGGLHIGQIITRQDAIDDFCHAAALALGEDKRRIFHDLAYRNKIWRKLRRFGNRAVKITITYEYPE